MKKTDLELKLVHLENRTEKYNLQLLEVDSMVQELIKDLDLLPTDDNIRNLETECRIATRKFFDYSNYLAKRIPDFNVIPESMVKVLLAPDTTLESIITYYQSILYLSSVPYEDLEYFDNLNKISSTDKELKDAIAIGKYLDELDYDSKSIDMLQSEFAETTFKVISAVNTFRSCSNFIPQLADKHFVVMTQHLIRLYLKHFSKTFSAGREDMPYEAKTALKSLVNRLDELGFENLRNNFEL